MTSQPQSCTACGGDAWMICAECNGTTEQAYYCSVECQQRDWRRHWRAVHAPAPTGAMQLSGVHLPTELVMEIIAKLEVVHERDYIEAAQSAQTFAATSINAYVAVNDWYLRRYADEIGPPNDAPPPAAAYNGAVAAAAVASSSSVQYSAGVVDWPRRYAQVRYRLSIARSSAFMDVGVLADDGEFGWRKRVRMAILIAELIEYNAAQYMQRRLTAAQIAELESANLDISLRGAPIRRISDLLGRFRGIGTLILTDLPNLESITSEIVKLDRLTTVLVRNCPKLLDFPESFYTTDVRGILLGEGVALPSAEIIKQRFAANGMAVEVSASRQY
jgi:hypothetical protein